MKIKTYLFYSPHSFFFFLSYKKQNCGCTYCSLPYPKVIILLGIIVWFQFGHDCWQRSDFPGDSLVKLFACQCGRCRRCGFEPWVGKIPWRRKWQPSQYSYLEDPMDRGVWWVANSRPWPSTHWQLSMPIPLPSLLSFCIKQESLSAFSFSDYKKFNSSKSWPLCENLHSWLTPWPQ